MLFIFGGREGQNFPSWPVCPSYFLSDYSTDDNLSKQLNNQVVCIVIIEQYHFSLT
jgi:hypothetical protein